MGGSGRMRLQVRAGMDGVFDRNGLTRLARKLINRHGRKIAVHALGVKGNVNMLLVEPLRKETTSAEKWGQKNLSGPLRSRRGAGVLYFCPDISDILFQKNPNCFLRGALNIGCQSVPG
jgi:hypothetical protein